jgi:hypothetical protein
VTAFRATFFFDVAQLAPPGSEVAAFAFDVELNPPSTVLVLAAHEAWEPVEMKMLNGAGDAWIDPIA